MIGTPAVLSSAKMARLRSFTSGCMMSSSRASGHAAKDQRTELATVQDPTTVEDRLAKGRDNGGESRAAFCYHLSTHCIRCYNRNAMPWSIRHTVDLPAPIPPVKPYTAIRLAPLSISTRLYSAAIPGCGPLQLDCGIYRTAVDDSQWREDECSPGCQTLVTLLLQSGR